MLGALLGGAAACYALPRAITASAPACTGADSTSPWWGAGGASGGSGESEQSFGDRLNQALSAARVGEAAAQQVLLVRGLVIEVCVCVCACVLFILT